MKLLLSLTATALLWLILLVSILGASARANSDHDVWKVNGLHVGDHRSAVETLLGPPIRCTQNSDPAVPLWIEYQGGVRVFFDQKQSAVRVYGSQLAGEHGAILTGASREAVRKVLGRPATTSTALLEVFPLERYSILVSFKSNGRVDWVGIEAVSARQLTPSPQRR